MIHPPRTLGGVVARELPFQSCCSRRTTTLPLDRRDHPCPIVARERSSQRT
jgi:hypothetical protein